MQSVKSRPTFDGLIVDQMPIHQISTSMERRGSGAGKAAGASQTEFDMHVLPSTSNELRL